MSVKKTTGELMLKCAKGKICQYFCVNEDTSVGIFAKSTKFQIQRHRSPWILYLSNAFKCSHTPRENEVLSFHDMRAEDNMDKATTDPKCLENCWKFDFSSAWAKNVPEIAGFSLKNEVLNG